MKRPLTEAANQLTDSEEKKQILKLIELFSDELTETDPYLCRMPIQTYQQFLRFCEISDRYKFLTNFENMVKMIEDQTEKESNEIRELKEIIEQKNYTISKLTEANKMLSDKVKELEAKYQELQNEISSFDFDGCDYCGDVHCDGSCRDDD